MTRLDDRHLPCTSFTEDGLIFKNLRAHNNKESDIESLRFASHLQQTMGRIIREIVGALTEPKAATPPNHQQEVAATAAAQQQNDVESQGLKDTGAGGASSGSSPAEFDAGGAPFENVLQQHVSNLLEGRLGSLLTWVPFILVLSIAKKNPLLAIWLAFGVSSILVVLEFYHGSYKPNYARFYWLTVSPWITYLILGIVYVIVPFSWTLISNIVVSSMFLAVLVSLLVGCPFTIQHARERVPPEVAATPGFYKLNVYLTLYWLLLFGIMMVCSWGSYPLPDDSTGNLILGTIIPIAVPIVGIKLMPAVVEYLKQRGDTDTGSGSAPQPKP